MPRLMRDLDHISRLVNHDDRPVEAVTVQQPVPLPHSTGVKVGVTSVMPEPGLVPGVRRARHSPRPAICCVATRAHEPGAGDARRATQPGKRIGKELYVESGFNPDAVSSVGAEGIAQFMPATWAAHGVDANGDGIADVWDPADAIPSGAAYDCQLASELSSVPGDPTSNMLAAYNTGVYAVPQNNGVPLIDAPHTGAAVRVELYNWPDYIGAVRPQP